MIAIYTLVVSTKYLTQQQGRHPILYFCPRMPSEAFRRWVKSGAWIKQKQKQKRQCFFYLLAMVVLFHFLEGEGLDDAGELTAAHGALCFPLPEFQAPEAEDVVLLRPRERERERRDILAFIDCQACRRFSF